MRLLKHEILRCLFRTNGLKRKLTVNDIFTSKRSYTTRTTANEALAKNLKKTCSEKKILRNRLLHFLSYLQFSRTMIFQEAPFLFELCRIIFDCFAAAATLVMPQCIKLGFRYLPKIHSRNGYLKNISSCCLSFFLKIFSYTFLQFFF